MKLPLSSKIYHGMYERILPCETTHVSARFCFGIEREFEVDNISNKKKLCQLQEKGYVPKSGWSSEGDPKKAINI